MGSRVGLIDEIIRLAVDRNSSVADLLRMALVASSKLKTAHMKECLEYELNGYPSHDDLPEYRRLRGTIKAWNPYHGWQIVHGLSEEMLDVVAVRPTPEGVAEIAQWIVDNGSIASFSLGRFSDFFDGAYASQTRD